MLKYPREIWHKLIIIKFHHIHFLLIVGKIEIFKILNKQYVFFAIIIIANNNYKLIMIKYIYIYEMMFRIIKKNVKLN